MRLSRKERRAAAARAADDAPRHGELPAAAQPRPAPEQKPRRLAVIVRRYDRDGCLVAPAGKSA